MSKISEIIRLGNVYGYPPESSNYGGLVFDPSGYAPTINCMGGGLRMPLIIEVEENDRNRRKSNTDSPSND